VTASTATTHNSTPAAAAAQEAGRTETRRYLGLLVTGCVLALGLGALLLTSWFHGEDLFVRVTGVIAASFVGGRMPGILTALELGFDGWTTVFLLILLNTTWLFIAIPLIAGISRKALRWRAVARFRTSATDRASAQAQTVSSLGSWALPFFIWLPFPLTGAVVGSLIGLVLGIPLRRLMYVVIVSMWSGIVMWTFGMEFVYFFAGTTGKIICYAVTAGVLGYSLALRVGRGRP
jgi:uncharacterized membrane protein